MDADHREVLALIARLQVSSSRCGRNTAGGRGRIGDWRERKRKRQNYGYAYGVLIFHYLFSFHCFWPSLTSRL